MKLTTIATVLSIATSVAADPVVVPTGTYTRLDNWVVAASPNVSCGVKSAKIVFDAANVINDFSVDPKTLRVNGESLPLYEANDKGRLYGTSGFQTQNGHKLEVFIGLMVSPSGRAVFGGVTSVDGKIRCSDTLFANFRKK